jgi:uncharacterized protein (TIGR02246 family)
MEYWLMLVSWVNQILICAALGIVIASSPAAAVDAKSLQFLNHPPQLITANNPAQNGKPDVIQPEQMQQMIQQAREAWIAGDADAWATLFTTDGEMIVHGQRWVGQQQIRQALADFTAGTSAVKIEIRRIIVDGNQAVVEWYWQDQDKAGRRHQADDVIVIDFKANRINRWREYIDTETPVKLPLPNS